MSAQSTSSKTRSPNYPAISLNEAIERLKGIYETQRRYPATRETFAKLMGYGSLNGASATVVSALGKYGLLEGHGDNLRVSEIGQDLVLHRSGDQEYASAIQQAAFFPRFFQELRDEYAEGLPSDHSLRANLIKKGFNSKAIDSAVGAYRETVDFLRHELEHDALDSTPSRSKPDPLEAGGVNLDSATQSEASGKRNPASGNSVEERTLEFQIAQETRVSVAFIGPVTQEAIQKFIQLLEVSMDTFPTKASLTPTGSSQPHEDDS